MGSVNLVIVVGNLGKDPEVKFMQNGTPVCNFSVATSEQWKDKEGQKQEKTEWHRIVVWGKQAEACGQELKKGRPVCVEGKIQTRDSEKDGVTKYVTEIKADRVTFLGGKPDGAAATDDPAPF
jgi:single-strand DNA-binding protein